MRLRVFQSGAGDCVLLSSDTDKHILVDGGFRGTYKDHVRPSIAIGPKMQKLDLVCVSHIDSDHISGVLQLLDDTVDWRVFRHHESSPNPSNVKRPTFPEPPPISEIWYNGFRDMVDDVTPIENMLLFSMRSLGTVESLADQALDMQHLATGVKQGLELSNRISPEQLGIGLNTDFDGGLMMATDPVSARSIGGINISVIGPFLEDLENLRSEWNDWLDDNKKVIEELHEKAEEDQDRLQLEEGSTLIGLLANIALDAQQRGTVTTPNLASIVLLAEDANGSVLLTGDARDEEILDGLAAADKLDNDGQLHVNVLKLQHHGSINNVNRAFCKAITADKYVICGASGGNHENPDIAVLDFILDSRIGPAQHQSQHPLASGPFSLVFSTNEVDGTQSTNKFMKGVKTHVEAIANSNSQRVSVEFMKKGGSFIDIQL